MTHPPLTETDIQKVYTIAKGLDISLEEAAVTCDGFELAFSNDGMRRAIFDIIDQLDADAARKGEPLGLIITYAVELGLDGIRVGRYADEIPAGRIVELTPSDRARILLKISDNFPTQQFLGPLIVNRPDCGVENESADDETPDGFSQSEWTEVAITDVPAGPDLHERLPFLRSENPLQPPLKPLLASAAPAAQTRRLLSLINAAAASHSGQSASGLSPPRPIGELGHSVSKDVQRPSAFRH